MVPNDQRIYQNLPINKGFHYGPVNPEKKGEWSDHWNGNNFEKDSKDYNKDEKLVIKETEEEFQR